MRASEDVRAQAKFGLLAAFAATLLVLVNCKQQEESIMTKRIVEWRVYELEDFELIWNGIRMFDTVTSQQGILSFSEPTIQLLAHARKIEMSDDPPHCCPGIDKSLIASSFIWTSRQYPLDTVWTGMAAVGDTTNSYLTTVLYDSRTLLAISAHYKIYVKSSCRIIKHIDGQIVNQTTEVYDPARVFQAITQSW